MLTHLFTPLQRAVALAARRAVFGSAGGLLILAGLVFLTIAAWIFLDQQYGAMTAALILGLVFLGFGLIVVAIGMHRPRPPQVSPHERPRQVDTVALVNAFLGGLSAGNGIRKR